MNSKYKGDLSVLCAIKHFGFSNYEVLLPIGDKKPYDFVIEKYGVFKKVQCKFTSFQTSYGIFQTTLRICGGNRTFQKIKKYDKKDFDILFVLTSNYDIYEIPFEEVTSSSAINLGEKFEKFRFRENTQVVNEDGL